MNRVRESPIRDEGGENARRIGVFSVLQQEQLVDEVAILRKALRESRERLHRGALESTRRIFLLSSEVTRLESLNSAYRRYLELSGEECPIVELARRLVECHEENEALRRDALRVGILEKALRDACAECDRMACERDDLAQELIRLRKNLVVF